MKNWYSLILFDTLTAYSMAADDQTGLYWSEVRVSEKSSVQTAPWVMNIPRFDDSFHLVRDVKSTGAAL